MRILLLGDVVGRSGRDAVSKYLPGLRRDLNLDFVLVNVDNAAGGWGVNEDCAKEMFKNGADVLTGGDHVWDQKEIHGYLGREKHMLRPLNYPSSNAGSGVVVYNLADGRKVLVVHALGQVFIKDNVNDPFSAVLDAIQGYHMGSNVAAIVVDFHAEATSEKNAMGVFLDGKVSVVAGTHTHVPTADERILLSGTAYQTDIGMCGDYTNTIIGWDAKVPMDMFLKKSKQQNKMQPAKGEGSLAGLFVETDDKTGLAIKVERVKRR